MAGNYPPPPGASDIPGLEVSGTITALGSRVTEFRIGDPVCALLSGGGYAEYAAAPVGQLLPIPKNLTYVEAAGLPETFYTVWMNLFDKGRLKKGDSVLIHAGASGIGTTAIMLCNALGIDVIATAGSARKREACVKLGARVALDYKEEHWGKTVKSLTGGRGVTLVLDVLGGSAISQNLQSLAFGGKMITIAVLQGSQAQVNFASVLMKNLTIMGSTLRSQSGATKGRIGKKLQQHVWPLLEQGQIKPVIDRVFPLEKAAEAHAYMQSNEHIGKIILQW